MSSHVSFISKLNDDCLYEIFLHLAFAPFDSPPKFGKIGPVYPAKITVQSHQNLSLLSCCLVSQRWYTTARLALHHRIILKIDERDVWYERASLLVGGEARRWVRSLTIVGGGERMIMGLPITPIWALFPNLTEVSIFGLGWGTGGLLMSNGPGLADAGDVFQSIRKVEITATSALQWTDRPKGRNYQDIQSFLGRLPNLQELTLKGLHYRIPLLPDSGIPACELRSLVLYQCHLSLEAFAWLIVTSHNSLKHLYLQESILWEEPEKQPKKANSPVEDTIYDISKRLDITLPLAVACES